MKRLFYSGLLGMLVLLVSGCIPFSDLGQYWGQGTIDPAIEGHWKQEGLENRFNDVYISFEKTNDFYRFYSVRASDPESEPRKSMVNVKSLILSGTTFLVVQADQESFAGVFPSGAMTERGLQRYAVSNGVLSVYTLDRQFLLEAVKSGRVAGKPREKDMSGPTIDLLDADSILFLTQAVATPEHWRIGHYRRVVNLDRELALSRAYPATKKTERHATVFINQPDLAYFSTNHTHILQRHLAAAPEWKVSGSGNVVECKSRAEVDGRWTLKSWKLLGCRVPATKLFRFSQSGGDEFTNERNRDMTSVVGPLAEATSLSLRSSSRGVESYVAVGQEGLWFEIHEQSEEEDRVNTRVALEWLSTYLREVRQSEAQIEELGFAPQLMPEGGVRTGKPTLEVEDGMQGGLYDVYGWINPGRQGQAFLRVFNVQSGEPLSVDRMFEKSNEYVGWSGDSEQLFFYNANVTIYGGREGEQPYEARFELWHRSSEGDEVKLIETTREVLGWRR